VADESGQRRAGIGGNSELGYGVVIADASGDARVGMGPLAGAADTYGMRIRDAAGDPQVTISASADRGSVCAGGANGRPVCLAP
jgi:hypothetical protein